MKPSKKIEGQEGLIAVIVGIDGYKNKPLHCAVNDAVYLMETLQKIWKNRGINIKILIWPSLNEEQAKDQRETWGIELPKDAGHITRDGILSSVRECAGLAGESDTFLFYFSGHGVLSDEEPALVTVADGKSVKGIELIKVREIQQAAAGCASRKKVMILDCCQSPLHKYEPVESYKNLEELTRGWSILLSSSPGEVSLEDRFFGDSRDDYLQQGVFTASLVEGLRGEAVGSSGSVTLADLAYFVGRRVPIEYQERLRAILTRKAGKDAQNQNDTRGMGSNSQNPVLLGDAVAMGGPYKIIMAPVIVPVSHKGRKKIPGKHFMKNWFKFLWGKWPIKFPFRPGFHFAALLYAAAVTLTVLVHCLKPIDNSIQLLLLGITAGSVFIWWITLPFAVAANENQWHFGGYITPIFFLLWHCLVAMGFAFLCNGQHSISGEHNHFVYLVIDLFFIFCGVVVFGCNTSQVIIILAEPIRQDDRREIRQAIRAFQQFKYKMLGVDLYNFIPMVPVRPDLYFYLGAIAAAVIVFNIYQVMIAAELETARMLLLVTRNIFILILVAWLVFWYHSAFKFIQKEVYKR
ncbi:MAG: caspase family protein [Candidatus Aminicenantes bacterium]|nr:MAG: caspase family protein [Candidatus Aminicenantes bacterium]